MKIRDLSATATVLQEIGFPYKNITDLTLVCISALMDKTPRTNLIRGKSCLHDGVRVTDIIEYANTTFEDVSYRENTRESIRKHSLKYLIDSNLVECNADDPSRVTNSGNTNYTIVPAFEKLICSFNNKEEFNKLKTQFLDTDAIEIRDKIRALKKLTELTVTLPSGDKVILSPGEHNIIEKTIVENFFNIYKDPMLIYIGDTANKVSQDSTNWDLCDLICLKIDKHSKIPDVIGFDNAMQRVMIWEAVASSGPINDLRKKELIELFKDCPFKIDYFTVFLSTKVYQKFASNISSNTSVIIIENEQIISYSNCSNLF
ncbi:MAG: hypothetical protein ACI8WT_003808 [Clostridium sp.]|jgi:hypothetical protein